MTCCGYDVRQVDMKTSDDVMSDSDKPTPNGCRKCGGTKFVLGKPLPYEPDSKKWVCEDCGTVPDWAGGQ